MNIFGLGTSEIIVILLVLIFFFGKDRMLDLAKSISASIRDLKNSLQESESNHDANSKD